MQGCVPHLCSPGLGAAAASAGHGWVMVYYAATGAIPVPCAGQLRWAYGAAPDSAWILLTCG